MPCHLQRAKQLFHLQNNKPGMNPPQGGAQYAEDNHTDLLPRHRHGQFNLLAVELTNYMFLYVGYESTPSYIFM